MELAIELLRSDIEFSFWADAALLRALGVIDSRDLEPGSPVSARGISKTLFHIFVAERVWLECLRAPVEVRSWRLPPDPPPDLPIEVLDSEWPVLHAGYRLWMEGLPSPDAMAEELYVELPNGRAPLLARWQVLRHVLDHSDFHRGQIVAALRALGRTPPAINRMDFWLSKEAALNPGGDGQAG